MENTCPMTRLPEVTTKTVQSRHSHEREVYSLKPKESKPLKYGPFPD